MMNDVYTRPTVADLERELVVLEHRLQEGERRIDDAERRGADTGAWESFWLDLLHRYESVCDQLHRSDAANNQLAA